MSWNASPGGKAAFEYARGLVGSRELPSQMAKLMEEGERLRLGKMMLAREEMDFLVWLARSMRVRDYLEIGVFVGLNALSMALRGDPEMRIHALDISVTHTDVARRHWKEAGVDSRITLILQSALLTLQQWTDMGVRERFDMILIDADKEPTPEYFDLCLPMLRKDGVIAIDNVLLGGRVCRDPDPEDPPSVEVMKRLNARIFEDESLDPVLLPVGDGLLLVRKMAG